MKLNSFFRIFLGVWFALLCVFITQPRALSSSKDLQKFQERKGKKAHPDRSVVLAAVPAGDGGEATLSATGAVTGVSSANGTVTVTPPSNAPLTWLGISTGAVPQADEMTDAIDGVNHDFFILTVGGTVADWAGKQISVKIDWTDPAHDYDLHIHKDTEFGNEVNTSAGGAPSTEEHVAIDPSVSGVGVYYLNVGYFSAPSTPNMPPPLNYQGTIAITTAASIRTASYLHGGMTFSPNSPLKASTASSDGEPSSRVDGVGNYYVCGIRGVPAGVDLWYMDLRPGSATYDPNLRAPIYRGQPDSTTSTVGQNQLQLGALGGGDIDLAFGFGNYTGTVQPGQSAEAVPALAYASLTAANITVGNTLDRGQTFKFNGAGNLLAGVPVNDRQWMGFKGNNIVYLVYRNFAQGIAFVQQSTNGGFTYGPTFPVGGVTFPQTGALDVDQTDGTVYFSSNDGQVAVGNPANNPPLFQTPNDAPQTYAVHRAVPATIDSANIFFPIRVAPDHTVYGVYSNGTNIFLVSSTDHGVTWASPVQVNDSSDANERVNLMPWLAAGPTPGTVGIAWYASDHGTNDDGARWRVYFAQTFDATAANPHFRVVQAGDHAIHSANISLKGLPLTGVAPNRNLIDYFQINFDTTGAAVIGYTDDHNDFSGHTFVTRQISGPSVNGNGSTNVPTPVEGASLPAQPFAQPGATPPTPGGLTPQPMQPGPNGEQVTDFAQDQDSGLLAVTPTNSPLDILSVQYLWQDSNTGPVITATMKVSDLSTIPPNTTWRMYFAANAPETGVINVPGNSFSAGQSDRGDQFYIEAATGAPDQNGNFTRTFNWGTVVREFKGTTTDTQQGSADRGFFNQQINSISVRFSTSKTAALLQSRGHPVIQLGSVLCGLRANSFQTNSSGIALEDYTRGGTELAIANPF